jgi:hypothetical protein
VFWKECFAFKQEVRPPASVEFYTKEYPKFSGLATWSENCKLCSSLSLGAVVSLFRESV